MLFFGLFTKATSEAFAEDVSETTRFNAPAWPLSESMTETYLAKALTTFRRQPLDLNFSGLLIQAEKVQA